MRKIIINNAQATRRDLEGGSSKAVPEALGRGPGGGGGGSRNKGTEVRLHRLIRTP